MKTINITRRFAPAAASAILAVLGTTTFSYAVTTAPFIADNPLNGKPVGWAYAGNKFIGTILGDGVKTIYSTDLNGGNVQQFGTLGGGFVSLNPSYGTEHYVSSSLGLGNFPLRDVYVASGNNIQHITNAGVADPGLFIQSGSTGGINGDIRGITFDSIGTFNYDMLITTHTGFVYKVDNLGNATQIASTGEDTEGLDLAPIGAGAAFGVADGSLFIASEGSGSIRAIDPITLAMSVIATVPSAEELTFVPMNLGPAGTPLEGLYGANYDKNVVKIDGGQFAGMQGNIIITGETNQAINRITAPFNFGSIGAFPLQPEDGLFLTANIINSPEPTSLGLLGFGALMMLRRRKLA